MHLRSRIEKVEQLNNKPAYMSYVSICPFRMVWPPTFPALREENNREE
uniref:Uncharacterized protein n=1 Tax=Arundo donax TaxID=35708 RepID=A0A0A8XS09_ARUDO